MIRRTCRPQGHLGHVADIDRAFVARGQQQVRHLGRRVQRLPGLEVDLICPSSRTRPVFSDLVRPLHLGGELLKRDAV